ncbi:glycosyltransferase [Aeromonas caviae]|uniref:glycosyltransferase n=1 Tax=Aeromonas caviae TaxID=648 RepID=UPI0038D019E4
MASDFNQGYKMANKKAVVCIVAYNRISPLVNLLTSVLKLHNSVRDYDIVVSIDKSEKQNEVINAVKSVDNDGIVNIIPRDNRLGLKKHILSCADIVLSGDYQYLVMLEDDLEISKFIFPYIESALGSLSKKVGGISLYSYKKEERFGTEFSPKLDGFDNFYMQYASSWGQVWTPEMWMGFKSWFVENDCDFFSDDTVPDYISRWPKSSWKKHYIRYLIQENKYFMYPHFSLSSNTGADGENHKGILNLWKVNLLSGDKKWNISSFYDSKSVYDVNFLPVGASTSVKNKSDLYKEFLYQNAIGPKGYLYLFLLSLRRSFLKG